jgi:hypothetical protein
MAEQEAWKQLYEYWLSKHAGGRPPSRRDLDPPVDIPRLIANIMLIAIDGDRFRYRLVGSALWNRYGLDLTGTMVEGRNSAESEWLDTLRAVRDDRAARLVTSPVEDHADRMHVAVALPLSAEGGAAGDVRIGQILAGIFFAQEFSKNPRVGRLFVREILGEE